MYIEISDGEEDGVEGFKYRNTLGEFDYVIIDYDNGLVKIKDDRDGVSIIINDIPKLIKALKAAVAHLEGRDYHAA